MNKFRRAIAVLSSVEMILFSMGLMMVLVFFGTLAQVHIGTFAAQKAYFNSFVIYGEPFGFRMPVMPGGLIVGAVWFVSLVAAFISRFRFLQKNTGILISHAGLILLLFGQFLTQTLAIESQMGIEEGQTRNYSESFRDPELVFVDVSNPDFDNVISIPLRRYSKEGPLVDSKLPFNVVIRKFFANVNLRMKTAGGESMATQGIGPQVLVDEIPAVTTDNETNATSAYVEILEGDRSLGVWLVSGALGAPQSFTIQGKEYQLSIRPRRTYYPFSLTLKEFNHDKYEGTDIPKNFSSLVHLSHPEKKEDRDVLIYMNNPLRYEGKTFYQASFGKNDTLSIFQVVENPAWVTPYISCLMVVLGLAIQFLRHLILFTRKRT